MSSNICRIENLEEVKAYISKLRYALDSGATLTFQIDRNVDKIRDERCTNRYTVAKLFPNENPVEALKRELKQLTVENYIRTVKDVKFPKRSEMREFGKVYNNTDEVYIKIRVELLDAKNYGTHTTFVMSFHFAERPFLKDNFPYRKGE